MSRIDSKMGLESREGFEFRDLSFSMQGSLEAGGGKGKHGFELPR